MREPAVVLMTDHSSTEGSRAVLATAVERLTGTPPMEVDARHFMTGGAGRARVEGGQLHLRMPEEDIDVVPSVVLLYEIPPQLRHRFEAFQGLLRRSEAVSLGSDADAWRRATDKNLMGERFAEAGIPHMEMIGLSLPTHSRALEAFNRLGRDVWARPSIGMGGNDIRHITTEDQLHTAVSYYQAAGIDWQMSRDAGNFTTSGVRHQFRVVVLDGRVVRACEHVQPDPDAPCNESRGATSTLLPVTEVPGRLGEIAVDATASLGLPMGGVDLASENGGVVFEVNVHPVFGSDRGLETVAIPYTRAHLMRLHDADQRTA